MAVRFKRPQSDFFVIVSGWNHAEDARQMFAREKVNPFPARIQKGHAFKTLTLHLHGQT
jgi:hypothetical protein